MKQQNSLKNKSHSQLSPTLLCWKKKCQLAKKGLKSGKFKTVVDAAEQLEVNHRMLSRYSKRFDINLNLKNHGVTKKTTQIKSIEDSLWSLIIKVA